MLQLRRGTNFEVSHLLLHLSLVVFHDHRGGADVYEHHDPTASSYSVQI